MDEEEKKCDACGRDLVMPGGVYDWAIEVEIRTDIGVSEEAKAVLAAMMGPYDLDRVYRVCYACYLRSLGIAP